MASELTVQTIRGPLSGANANTVVVPAGQTLDISNSTLSGLSSSEMPAGSIISINTFRNGTRTALGSLPAGYTLFGGTFNKKLSNSLIVATCTVYGAQFASGNCGVGLKLDSSWDYGVAYQYDGSWLSTLQTTIVTGTCQWSGISAGSHTMYFGWNPINGSSGEKPFSIFNPNNSDDPRNQQMVSSIVVYEVAQ